MLEVFIPGFIESLAAGSIPVERLMHTGDFDQLDEAADAAEASEVVKVVVRTR